MRSALPLLSALVVLLPHVALSDSGEEITLSLEYGMMKCFRHSAHVDASVVGEVLVVDGPASDLHVDLVVHDQTSARVVLQRTNIDHLKFTLDPVNGRRLHRADPQAVPPVVGSAGGESKKTGQPHAGGGGHRGRLTDELVEYRVCVTGRSATGKTHRHQPGSAESMRKVFFSFRTATDVGYLDHVSHDQVLELVSRKTEINALKTVAVQIETSVKRILQSVDEMRRRETQMFSAVSRSADEIFWYSLSACAAIVAFGIVISLQSQTMLKKAVR